MPAQARLWWPALLLGLVLAAACAGPIGAPGPPSSQPITLERQLEALIVLGEERLERGRYSEAADAFRAALEREPTGDQRAKVLYGMARVELGRGDAAGAQQWLGQLAATGVPANLAVPVELLQARIELDQGRAPAASARLGRLLSRPPGPLTAQDRMRAQELLAQAMSAQSDHARAAALLLEAAQGAEPIDKARLAEALRKAAGQASSQQVDQLLRRAGDDKLRAALMLALAQAYLSEGRLVEADDTLRRLRAWPAASPWIQDMSRLDGQINQARLVDSRAVGVILPLSGEYAGLGKRLLSAVELGLGLFSSGGGATLYIADSQGQAEAAAQAVSRLVEQNRVMAIIGPVGAASSLAAARRAQQLGVPMITLSQVDGATMAGDYVFQNCFTPAAQVEALLGQVTDQWGLTRLAVLAPKNGYGHGFARLMQDHSAARGARVVRTVYYGPEQTDFAVQIKELVRLPLGDYRPGHPDSPQPVIDFQALLVPDGPQRAAMIAPQLAYFDVLGIQLMGSSLWHNPLLIERGGRYVNGSLFPDAFDPDSARPLVRDFVRDFRAALSREPDTLDAHAYDAGLMLRSLLRGAATRSSLRAELAAMQGVEGVCGQLAMGQDRRVVNALELFTVKRGKFMTVDQAGMLAPQPPAASQALPGQPNLPAQAGPTESTITDAGAPPSNAGAGAAADGQSRRGIDLDQIRRTTLPPPNPGAHATPAY